MMRRRMCVGAVLVSSSGPSLEMQCRHQSRGNSSNNKNSSSNRGGAGSGGGRMHQFIRDNAPAAAAGSSGAAEDLRSAFPGDARPQAPRAYARQGPSPPTAGGGGGAPPAGDWAAQLQAELFGSVDPLGGMAHRDYYRDPAAGYAPQYAPRNFARGGEIAYHHPQSAQDFAEAAARREWGDQDVLALRGAAAAAGRQMRGIATAEERARLVARHVPDDRFAGHLSENASLALGDQLFHSGPTSAEQQRRQATLGQVDGAAPLSAAPVASAVGGAELRRNYWRQAQQAHDDSMDERLRVEYGLRAKERFDFNILQRSTRVPFEGYDSDRFHAQAKGTPYAAAQLPPNMAPSSMEEAQNNLRGGGGGGDGAPAVESLVQHAFANNTVTDCPKLDEALTEEVVGTLRASEEAADEAQEQRRRQRFGFGRQGALVQDAGPDKRVLKKHTHDERIFHAENFKQHAHRHHVTDEHVNPYVRNDTSGGVGHLLNNRFDIERREDRLARGEQDLTERNAMHLGTPVSQTIDEFVFRHRNARGERPLDYFKPFPDFRAHRLSRMYQDTEGFSLMKQRPEFLEWELFVRFRAHHQQRRELALLHGLEPVANETAQERDARRLALDQLCEQTPFDPTRMKLQDDEVEVDVETLRSWFGVYLLPSPTIVEAVTGVNGALNLHLQHRDDALGTTDRREHLLSGRYMNTLLLIPGFAQRLGRGFVESTFGKAPEPVVKYAQPPEVLRHFDAADRRMYEDYVRGETQKQMGEWGRIWQGRRYVPEKGQYGQVVSSGTGGGAVPVVDVQREDTGALMTVAVAKFEKELAAARAKATGGVSASLSVDGQLCTVVAGSERSVTPLTVQLDSGEMLETTDEEFTTYPLEVDAGSAHHHHLDYGIANYAYNRGNYIETQDVLWEEATAKGVEGWSPATHVDGLRPGLPVRARRQVTASGGEGVARGDYQRGRIVEYLYQPFFNPDPRTVTVAFAADGAVEAVPLSALLIWQRQNYGPERTVGDSSRRYQPQGLRRYVDVADPLGEKKAGAATAVNGQAEHFLDKYEARDDSAAKQTFRTTKQITEIDGWTGYDNRRADNHRPLSISHRRDYIRQGYMHKYTPWEWIAIQEADQPIIRETMRSDNLGASHFFSLNRFWRYKARPHGYIRNYENEVRDLFQFVDGITPWKQAQKIRTYWEVRRHHPMPQFNRPEVAMHRNNAALLPAHIWETDKKTGKVKAVKDSVRDYQTKTPVPSWVQL